MDTAFLFDESSRANFFQLIMQSIPYTYICLWSNWPQSSSFLSYMDGFFNEENNQPSSSSGTQARRLFEEYRQSVFTVENECVPGLAFKNSRPYLELQEVHLQRFASKVVQRQFYQAAGIKTAIFMGCKSGEIEIGFSNVPAEIDIEKELRSWFTEDFSRQFSPLRLPDPNPPSSSSSLSMDSPEYSSLLFNIPNTTHLPETLREVVNPTLQQIPTPSPHQAAMQEYARLQNIQLPNPETEAAAITRAIFNVLTSPSSASSSQQPHTNLPYSHQVVSKFSAFKRYASPLGPRTTQVRANLGQQSMMKRSFAFFKSLNYMRVSARIQASRPTTTQLHHMISERKRREKLNESFQALRSLLPPGTKKDKASLLATTREYLSSLKAQVEELNRKNQLLEAHRLPAKEAKEEETSSSNERLIVRTSQVSESTSSEERIVDLQVIIRGECPMVDILIRILEFLKQVKNVSLQSMETNTRIIESSSMNHIILRLRIEGPEWDESAFQEAVRRVVADLAP
ncbi:putative transcription factor bHLH041 isoform X1 [Quercus robur]|uniref:putative transcription factor bHLH041 isoform X1 n=1 Tax=Quercus robur TaxID=38942 RepID=UPI0021611092|nr:putative transcription factor bHLH041 isoform X1 [Quercus robur]